MNALEAAKKQMEHAEQMDGEYAGPALQWVNVYAAIATAEAAQAQAHAMERMAESLERALPVLGRIADALHAEDFGGKPRGLASILSSIEAAQA